MHCFCCGGEISDARKVKIRRMRDFGPWIGGPEAAAYMSYVEESTYRWGVVCHDCYYTLDNESGGATIAEQFFTIAGSSRGDKARTLTEAQYRKWQRREAAKLGVDLEDEH